MKKGAIININKNNFINYIKNNKIVIMLTAAFIIGIALGSILSLRSNIAADFSEDLFAGFLKNRQGRGFFKIFSYSFKLRFLILLCCFLSGSSLMGIVFVPSTVIFSGFIYGTLSAYVCHVYLLKGIAFNALIIIPTATLFIISLLLAAVKSIYFSFEFIKLVFPNSRPINLFISFKEVCGYYLIYLSVALCSAVIDALLSKALISYFEFV